MSWFSSPFVQYDYRTRFSNTLAHSHLPFEPQPQTAQQTQQQQQLPALMHPSHQMFQKFYQPQFVYFPMPTATALKPTQTATLVDANNVVDEAPVASNVKSSSPSPSPSQQTPLVLRRSVSQNRLPEPYSHVRGLKFTLHMDEEDNNSSNNNTNTTSNNTSFTESSEDEMPILQGESTPFHPASLTQDDNDSRSGSPHPASTLLVRGGHRRSRRQSHRARPFSPSSPTNSPPSPSPSPLPTSSKQLLPHGQQERRASKKRALPMEEIDVTVVDNHHTGKVSEIDDGEHNSEAHADADADADETSSVNSSLVNADMDAVNSLIHLAARTNSGNDNATTATSQPPNVAFSSSLEDLSVDEDDSIAESEEHEESVNVPQVEPARLNLHSSSTSSSHNNDIPNITQFTASAPTKAVTTTPHLVAQSPSSSSAAACLMSLNLPLLNPAASAVSSSHSHSNSNLQLSPVSAFSAVQNQSLAPPCSPHTRMSATTLASLSGASEFKLPQTSPVNKQENRHPNDAKNSSSTKNRKNQSKPKPPVAIFVEKPAENAQSPATPVEAPTQAQALSRSPSPQPPSQADGQTTSTQPRRHRNFYYLVPVGEPVARFQDFAKQMLAKKMKKMEEAAVSVSPIASN